MRHTVSTLLFFVLITNVLMAAPTAKPTVSPDEKLVPEQPQKITTQLLDTLNKEMKNKKNQIIYVVIVGKPGSLRLDNSDIIPSYLNPQFPRIVEKEYLKHIGKTKAELYRGQSFQATRQFEKINNEWRAAFPQGLAEQYRNNPQEKIDRANTFINTLKADRVFSKLRTLQLPFAINISITGPVTVLVSRDPKTQTQRFKIAAPKQNTAFFLRAGYSKGFLKEGNVECSTTRQLTVCSIAYLPGTILMFDSQKRQTIGYVGDPFAVYDPNSKKTIPIQVSWNGQQYVIAINGVPSIEGSQILSDAFKSAKTSPNPSDEQPFEPNSDELAASISDRFDSVG